MNRETAISILKRLRDTGFQAFFAGGCVRDQVMGITPKDYDIATNARPEDLVRLFARTVTVGAQFGVVRVVEGEYSCEVATFRRDGTYEDGRHPGEVIYTEDPRLDVLRRDFTINGLLYDPLTDRILDYVGGEQDIQARVLQTIGHPRLRFSEDKLRLMRAIRFTARFQLHIETETLAWIHRLAPQIVQVSRERVRDELVRILTEGCSARGIRLLEDCLLLVEILPEVSQLKGVDQPPEFHPEGDVWVHTLLMLRLMDQTAREQSEPGGPSVREAESADIGFGGTRSYPSLTLAMGVLLHDIGKPPTFEVKDRIRFNGHTETGARMAAGICERLRFPNKETERILELVRDHLVFKDLPRMRLSTLKRFLRRDGFTEHLELHRLDCLGSHRNLENWQLANRLAEEMGSEEIRPPRLLTGNDLIAMGLEPGPSFKEMLKAVEDAQLEGLVQSPEEARHLVLERFREFLPHQSQQRDQN